MCVNLSNDEYIDLIYEKWENRLYFKWFFFAPFIEEYVVVLTAIYNSNDVRSTRKEFLKINETQSTKFRRTFLKSQKYFNQNKEERI